MAKNHSTQAAISAELVTVSLPVGQPEAYPSSTQFRLASVAMALTGAQEIANDVCAGGKGSAIIGILDLALSELRRIDEERDALASI